MAQTAVYNLKGEKVGQIRLPKEIFEAKINQPLMAQAVRVYLSNQRRARAKTKTRGEVTGSGRKIYRQKGTGRARHGDRYAPIFVGGGIAHGPRGSQNYKRRMPKKMRQKALFSALTSQLKAKNILLVEGMEKIKPRTKLMVKTIKALKLEDKKTSFVLPTAWENIIRAGRNIPALRLLQARKLNTYQVLNAGRLVFAKESIKSLKEAFLNES